MPAALALSAPSADRVACYVTALQQAGLRTGPSTVQAAKSFCARLDRAGGWEVMTLAEQVACESCTFFVTTIAFRPTLQAQRDDAHNKGQVARQKIFDGLLERLDHEAS